jgi:hypothetical protein
MEFLPFFLPVYLEKGDKSRLTAWQKKSGRVNPSRKLVSIT